MAKTTDSPTMDELLKETTITALRYGDSIEGKVISVQKHEVCLDIGVFGIGIIYQRELIPNHQLEPGQSVKVIVTNPETVNGHAVLSLRRALRNRGWDEIQRLFENNEIVSVAAYDANRGGLLIELEGIRGFLPVSQLTQEHYPRSAGYDRDEILNKLNKLVGLELKVTILDADRSSNKVIFSEREAHKEIVAKQIASLNPGDILEGTVTTVIDFGAFVNVNGVEGLVHISEISWQRIEDPRHHLKAGQKVKVKVVAIDKDRLRLSIRQLSQDPWLTETADLKPGSKVSGKVTRVTVFGAFIQISPVVEALVNINDVGRSFADLKADNINSRTEPSEAVKSQSPTVKPDTIFALDQVHEFTVLEVNSSGRKIALGLETVPPPVRSKADFSRNQTKEVKTKKAAGARDDQAS